MRESIPVWLSAVFAGLAVLLTVLAAVLRQPLFLIVAAPFGITAYLMWYHVSGRMEERVREEARRAGEREREHRTTGPGASGNGAESDDSPGITEGQARRVLGVDGDAGEAEIRAAYRERVKEVHPDAEDGNEERFKRVSEAYDRLVSE